MYRVIPAQIKKQALELVAANLSYVAAADMLKQIHGDDAPSHDAIRDWSQENSAEVERIANELAPATMAMAQMGVRQMLSRALLPPNDPDYLELKIGQWAYLYAVTSGVYQRNRSIQQKQPEADLLAVIASHLAAYRQSQKEYADALAVRELSASDPQYPLS